MTNPFKGRAFGARASAPQFPQRRAVVRKKKGGKIPGMFLGGLFSGTPATSSSSSTSTTNFGVTNPGYNRLLDSVMGRALPLSEKPYEAYTGQGVVPLSADQQSAFANVRGNQGNYQPFYGAAGQDIGQASGADPTGAGIGYLNQAGSMQNGTQAASPFIGAASQNFPGAVDQYMSPYTDKVVNRIAELGNRNLTENVLPGVNDTFTGGAAAQFGRERHADITGRAIRDNQESIMGQQAQALEQGYGMAGNLFNQDANRQAGLATTAGGLAQGDITQRAGLGTAAGNLTAQGAATNIAAGQAQAGLGQSTQQSGLTDANALSAAGSQQQQQAQNEETWKYNQWNQQKQDPYNKLSWAQGVGQGWTLPTQTSNQSQSQSTQTAAQGSPFGQILGAGIGLLGAAGGVQALGSLFGGSEVSAAAAPAGGYGGYAGYANTLPGFGASYGAAEGGAVPDYAQGGMIPSITAMRKAMQQPKGMPTGMPGMPPMPTLAPQLPQGQPNGQPASPFARGGSVGYADGGRVSPLFENMENSDLSAIAQGLFPGTRHLQSLAQAQWDRDYGDASAAYRRQLDKAYDRAARQDNYSSGTNSVDPAYAPSDFPMYADGGSVKGNVGRSPTQGPPPMSLEDQLDIFGKIIAGNSKANTGRGVLSPNPFLNYPNPELRYAEGGQTRGGGRGPFRRVTMKGALC